MKYILFLVPFFVFLSCSKNEVIKVDETPIITGKLSKSMLQNYDWFNIGNNEYIAKNKICDSIKITKQNLSIVIFMGTWCSDSQREIPRFFKIADLASLDNFTVYGLDRKKKSPEEIENKYNIEKVPTFIVFNDQREIGRIVEMPEKSLEEDLLNIFRKK